MRSKGQAVVDWCIVVVVALTWVELSLRGDLLGFSALGVVLVALLYRVWRPGAPAAEPVEGGAPAARPPGKRLALACLVVVLALIVLVGPQYLLARSVVLRSEHSINNRGHEVVGNHIVLGQRDVAWVRAEMESEGAINSQCGLFSGAMARITPLNDGATGLSTQAFRFDWELRFGWPFTVRRWKETQFVGPGGVQGWIATGTP